MSSAITQADVDLQLGSHMVSLGQKHEFNIKVLFI